MKTIACLNIYNEIDFIKDCLESIKWVDHIIMVDGAYQDFPHKSPGSDDGTVEACLDFEHRSLQLITSDIAWNSETEKRNEYLKHIEPDADTYCLVIDGDEMFAGELPYLTEDVYSINQIRGALPVVPIEMRIFRAMPGLHYVGAHNALWQWNRFLNSEDWPIAQGCQIRHLTDLRSEKRKLLKGAYVRKLQSYEAKFRETVRA